MRPYLSAFRIRIIAEMQYRAAAWAGIATQFFFGFVFVMIFDAFYKSAMTPPPMPFEQLISYLWLQQAFLALLALWYTDNELLNSIVSGDVAYELARPLNPYTIWYVRLVAQRISAASLRCLPILLVAFFLPARYAMKLPPDLPAFGLFAVSLVLAMLVATSMSMMIYVLTFITLSPSGARLLLIAGSDFLAGIIIPLPLMPDGLRHVLEYLPFRFTFDLPMRIYSGNIHGHEALFWIGMQLCWLIVMIAFGAWTLKRSFRRIVIQGG